jgi:FMN phosphatase YigB (HAD superfamily)
LAPALRTSFPATLCAVQRAKKAGVTVGIISNHLVSPPLFEYCADGAGLRLLVSDPTLLVVSQEVGLGKPDPAIYHLFIERLRRLDPSVLPEQLIFVDDKPKNVDAAIAAGWHGIVHDARLASETALAEALAAKGLALAPEEDA